MGIEVRIYDSEELRQIWAAYIRAVDGSWTLFIPADGGEPVLVANAESL